MPRKRNTPQTPTPTTDRSGYYCYVGPTIRSVLQTNTIVIGTKEDMYARARRAIEMAPSVRALLVPGDRLQEARNHIKNDINPEAAFYRRILRELKEEKANA